MTTTHARVLVVGETMGLLTSGAHLRAGGPVRFSVGGAETNTAIGLRRQGIPVRWLTRLGDDAVGESVLAAIRSEDVEAVAALDPLRPTGLMMKEARPGGLTRVSYYRSGSAASALSAADVRVELLDGVELLHVTGITPALSDSAASAVIEAVRLARACDIRVSLDVNYRSSLWSREQAGERLAGVASLADIVFGDRQELELLIDASTTATVSDEALLDTIAGIGPGEVVLKRGERGAVALADGCVRHQAVFPITPVDTVGAGDAFVAGYLAGVLDARPLDDRLRRACACGALACLSEGDWEGSPTVAELAAFLGGGDPVLR
ncbi:sugar kinase [Leifsonia sp. ZF2019]|uniref:sugar kinase n=1 Tax=Leifsonia sp. ZF2019 TaxID=2781978 RepID=UPI001CBF6CA3|nr:sugar kinase [Leifsonia sp. ZF2019]UAJ78834.1 sugar kinase [Leifsonia sp. ZF2019]